MAVDVEAAGHYHIIVGHGLRQFAPAAERVSYTRSRYIAQCQSCSVYYGVHIAVYFTVYLVCYGMAVDVEATLDRYIVRRHSLRNLAPAAEGVPFLARRCLRGYCCAIFIGLGFTILYIIYKVRHCVAVGRPAAGNGDVCVAHHKVCRISFADLPAAEGIAGQGGSSCDRHLVTSLVSMRRGNRRSAGGNGTHIDIGNIKFGDFLEVRDIDSVGEESIGHRRIIFRQRFNMRIPCCRIVGEHIFCITNFHCPVGKLIFCIICCLSFNNASIKKLVHLGHYLRCYLGALSSNKMAPGKIVVFDLIFDRYLLLSKPSNNIEDIAVFHTVKRNGYRILQSVVSPAIKCIASHTRFSSQSYSFSRMCSCVRRQSISLRHIRAGIQNILDGHSRIVDRQLARLNFGYYIVASTVFGCIDSHSGEIHSIFADFRTFSACADSGKGQIGNTAGITADRLL